MAKMTLPGSARTALIVAAIAVAAVAPFLASVAADRMLSTGRAVGMEPRRVEVRTGSLEVAIRARGRVVPARVAEVVAPLDARVVVAAREGELVAAGAAVARLQPLDASGADGEVELFAPLSGVVLRALADPGGIALRGAPLVLVQSEEMVIEAALEPSLLYRLEGPPGELRATIAEGPGPFPCEFLSLGVAPEGTGAGAGPVSYSLRCAIPPGTSAVVGSDASVQAVVARAENVMVVPRTAIDGLGGAGSTALVARLVDGRVVPTEIEIGLRSDDLVEVRGGLAVGDIVLDPPPVR